MGSELNLNTSVYIKLMILLQFSRVNIQKLHTTRKTRNQIVATRVDGHSAHLIEHSLANVQFYLGAVGALTAGLAGAVGPDADCFVGGGGHDEGAFEAGGDGGDGAGVEGDAEERDFAELFGFGFFVEF